MKLLIFCCALTFTSPSFAQTHRPKLILLLVIDQFRADYLTRFESHFLKAKDKRGNLGGFQYLMTHGAYFPLGRYDLLQSVTAPGHMTISTGSYPYQSGISNNYWYSTEQKKLVYCTEDPQSPILGSQRNVPSEGRSPRNLIGNSLGDQLKISGFPSQVISIALKDRAAILMGGHTADLALWFDPTDQAWTSSSYYVPSGKLPPWVQKLNQKSSQTLKKLQVKKSSDFLTLPQAGEFTIDAAEAALKALHLGQGQGPDLLAVSLSNHDKAGHRFGPNSAQMKEMTLADDRAMARLLNLVHQHVPGGLKNVVIAFTGDHGVAPSSTYSERLHLPQGQIQEDSLRIQLEDHLNQKLGRLKSGKWISEIYEFDFYLNRAGIEERGFDLKEVEETAKQFLQKTPGIAHVLTSTEYRSRVLPPGAHGRQVMHSYFPGHSGDLIIIPKPFFTPHVEDEFGATHATGYAYDRTVPIIFTGASIKAGTYATPAEVIDIAPTLSFLAGTIPPSLSEGRVISEMLHPSSRR